MTICPRRLPLARDGVALWRQHRAAPRRPRSAAGGLAPGARLPTEAQLADALRRQPPHRPPRARGARRATGWSASSRGAAPSSPRTCSTTRSAPRTRFSEWIRRQNKEPSGPRARSCARPVADARSPPGSACGPGARGRRAGAAGPRRRRPVSLGTPSFPAPSRCPACWTRCARHDGITEALRRGRRGGLSAPGRRA